MDEIIPLRYLPSSEKELSFGGRPVGVLTQLLLLREQPQASSITFLNFSF